MTKPQYHRCTGRVEQKHVSPGSKSDREAVVLITPSDEFVLRRQGGNPFHDEVLVGLVGKRIRCTGMRSGQTLILTEWEVA